jgi:hypothetical protein
LPRQPGDGVHGVVEGLLPLLTAMAALRLDPENARVHSERNVAAIAESLRRYGQRKPVVANKRTKIILAGNGTYVAAQRLGWTELACVWVQDDKHTARGYALADNRTAELAEWDHHRLSALMRELRAAEGDGAIVGWTAAEIEPIVEDEWRPPTMESDLPERPALGHDSPTAPHHYNATADERESIDRAIQVIRQNEGDDTIPEGRALELIAADYLAGR